ncbi:MAG: Ribosomal protein S23 [Parcubacteria group bacterium GW2011_GWC2_45_7]|nr:MAG: Ribosomal protein S23 [Parcubacteria group bacterium GW2011_GWC2_45_7]
MNIDHFTKLEAWQISHELVLAVYMVLKKFPKEERFGIIDQLRRAVSSITANIAEGWGRYHFADRIKFYYQARGSCSEVQNFLILSKDLGYLDKSEFDKLNAMCDRCFKIISGLIRAIDKLKEESR